MSTLYWITVLGNINLAGIILLITLLIAAFAAGFYPLINCLDPEDDERKKAFKISKKCLLYSVIPLLMIIFIPSSKRLYAIYGVGTVLDYTKNNKEVQKLPNNAVKALNVWLENVNKDKKDSINNN